MRLRTIFLLILIAEVGIVAILVAAMNRLPAGVTRGRIESGGRSRSYLLYVPKTYDPAAPAPLVLSLHGFASWPANQMSVSRWNELADQHGFILVYPAGTGFPKRWNAGGATGDKAVDDVAFLSDLIDALSHQFTVDPARIYVNGLSNGAGMSNLLACRLADRIAAMGGVAGAYTPPAEGCAPTQPVPIIAFHGTADPIVPYDGGAAGPQGWVFPAVPDWAAAWAARNGCDATPEQIPARGEVSGVKYSGCTGDANVVFYTVDGGGHSWPGGGKLPEAIVGHTTDDVDASALMWEFFAQHPRE